MTRFRPLAFRQTPCKALSRRARPSSNALLIRDARQAAAFGLSGTPAFIIGAVIYPGALRADDLDRAIREARG